LEELSEVKVVRSKRTPSAVKRKRHRRYLKKKSLLRRLNKKYRKTPESKRLAKRRIKIKKRLKIKSGSRKRVYVNSVEDSMEIRKLLSEIKELNECVSKTHSNNMIEAFDSAKILAQNILVSLNEGKEKPVTWVSGPNQDGAYTTEKDGKKSLHKNKLELDHLLRELLENGETFQWKFHDDQIKFDMGERREYSEFLFENIELPSIELESKSAEENFLDELLLGEKKEEDDKDKVTKGLEEPAPIDTTPIVKDLEEIVNISKKTAIALKNESIDEFDAHQLLMNVSQYLDKAARKFLGDK
jgi:hypothetical protein